MRPSTALFLTIGFILILTTRQQQKHSIDNGGCSYNNASITRFWDLTFDVTFPREETVDCFTSANSSFTSSMLKWSSGDSTAVNEKTLRLLLPVNGTNVGKKVYKCDLSTTGVKNKGICMLTVFIGNAPFKPENFSCLSNNMEYLYCTFFVPNNVVPTTYFIRILHGAGLRSYFSKTIEWPTIKTGYQLRGYNFTTTSELRYNYYVDAFELELMGNNSLNSSTWTYIFDHHSSVIPKEPEILSWKSDSRSIELSWDTPKHLQMISSAPKLVYRVQYISKWMKDAVTVNVADTTLGLAPLQPYVWYSINVSALSISANASDESKWGPPATIKVQTLSDVPDAPPEMTPGSFLVVSHISDRDVDLYWKSIPEIQKNGKNFRYSAKAVSLDNEIVYSTESDEGSAHFNNLSLTKSYTFYVTSVNQIGSSNTSTTLVLPPQDKLLNKPDILTVVATTPNQYNVSWAAPKNMENVLGYTVFHAASNRRFHKNYRGLLNWLTVNTSAESILITASDEWPYRYFALATYGEETSSDMLWNTCIVSYNGTLDKLRRVEIRRVDAFSITAGWVVDCAEKLGIVQGYVVYYCAVANINVETCNEEVKNIYVRGANTDSVTIKGVKPFTYYKVNVAVKTLRGESEISNSLHLRTNEAAPGNSSNGIQILAITNSSFVVKWHPPSEPNGEIRNFTIKYQSLGKPPKFLNHSRLGVDFIPGTYELNVTEDVFPYTTYQVSIQACNSVGCSKFSNPEVIRTDIGVPGQMYPPPARLVNLTHAVVQPEVRDNLNGPSLLWEIKVLLMAGDNQSTQVAEYVNITDNMTYIPLDCMTSEYKNAEFRIQTRAINVVGNESLVGPWSDYSKLSCVISAFSASGTILGIVIGASIGLVLILIVLFFVTKRVKIFIHKITGIKVIMPPGLEATNNYDAFGAGLMEAPHIYMKDEDIFEPSSNTSLLGGDTRFRNASSDTNRSATSTEELLLREQGIKNVWANDSITSGNNDSLSSRPSTTQTQLSSDSSMELAPSVPESPDSVFVEHPLKHVGERRDGLSALMAAETVAASAAAQAQVGSGFNPTLAPIGESHDGSVSRSSTPQHYSKFAGYYRGKDEVGSDITSPATGSTSRYVAAPYSQLGLSGEVVLNDGLVQAEPSTQIDSGSRSGAADHASGLPAYSKFGLTIPSLADQPFSKNEPTRAPLTSTPTHASYSVFGMGESPSKESSQSSLSGSSVRVTDKGYVTAAVLNDMNPFMEQDIDNGRPASMLPSTSKLEDNAQVSSPNSTNYVNMDAHKRSPSNASSLTAGYCVLGLSRPTSVSSETGHYVSADPSSCTTSPAKSSSCRTSLEVPSSPFPGERGPEEQGLPCNTDFQGSSPNGYATVQQLLKSVGNS